MTTAISEAISAYSMAVAPVSFFKKLVIEEGVTSRRLSLSTHWCVVLLAGFQELQIGVFLDRAIQVPSITREED